jgi:outer membrane protein TolC
LLVCVSVLLAGCTAPPRHVETAAAQGPSGATPLSDNGFDVAWRRCASCQQPSGETLALYQQDVPALTLSLKECVERALERQPRIAAGRASVAAAQEGLQSLEHLLAPALLAPELPIRRKQAALGVSAAMAALEQADRQAVYAVTRTYYTALYAREQESVAKWVVERLSATRDLAQRAVEGGARDVSTTDVERVTVYLPLAEAKQIQAHQGVERALVALREAIGLGCETVVDVPQGRLPEMAIVPHRLTVVAQALAHRRELIRAGVFVDATDLEVKAQASDRHRRMQTFAAGGDIHGNEVPAANQNDDYRPGGIAPEMPTLLVGTAGDRSKHAQALNARAVAVAETSANLIVLEAEDAVLRWQEASQKLPKASDAATVGAKLADDLSKKLALGARTKVEEVVNAQVLAAQARALYNEYHYRQIIALADLERITAGAFNAHLTEAAGVAR